MACSTADVPDDGGDLLADQDLWFPAGQFAGLVVIERETVVAAFRALDLCGRVNGQYELLQRDQILLAAAGMELFSEHLVLADQFHESSKVVGMKGVAKLFPATGERDRMAFDNSLRQLKNPAAC